jgi:hypothetical protein
MKSNNIVIASLAFMAMIVAACSAHVDSGPDGSSSPPTKQIASGDFSKPAIPGPNVEGDWSSGCSSGGFRTNRVVTLSFHGNSFAYTSTAYSDTNCHSAQSVDHRSGTFQFSQVNADGSYGIDYKYFQNGTTYIYEQQKLLLVNLNLYISEFVFATNIQVNKNLPLTKL